MNNIAIMQGRLSPQQNDRLQFFPEKWQAEFLIARELGFDCIEWFLDRDIKGVDPIRDVWEDAAALTKIEKARATLPISSIDCGKYKMFGRESAKTAESFKKLMPAAASRLSTKILSIPLLEAEAPKSDQERDEARVTLQTLADLAEPYGLRLALETEMPASELAEYADSFARSNIGITYDIGNCTSYGFDCPSDIKFLDKRIFEVHLKDRKIGSSRSVFLGTGDVDFDSCFQSLREIGYRGTYTLQAWRGTDYLDDAKAQLKFVKDKSHKYDKK